MNDSAKVLRVATLVYPVGFVIHNADHAHRGVGATPEPVVWAGTSVAMLTAVVITFVFTRHPLAPLVAAAGGAAIAIGVAITHLTPITTVVTDPLTVRGISPLSWIAVFGEIITAAVLAIIGLRAMRAAKVSTF
jgi:hypothetical protein